MGLIFGQTKDLGDPPSWWRKPFLANSPVTELPSFDVQRYLREDALREAEKIGPYRFGHDHYRNDDLSNAGLWTELNSQGDRIWRITYYSPEAYSLNFIFDEYDLPQGAALYLYNDQDRRHLLGAYTSENNNEDRVLGTELVAGDRITLEYYEPASVRGLGRLKIGRVIHAYKNVQEYAQGIVKRLNSSGNCNHDVRCPLGNGWEDQINSVALMIANGSGFCTGALINNVLQDGTPYFLTANHCFSGSPANWVFRFNWDSPVAVCASSANSVDPGPPYNSINGAVLRARHTITDFCLLELNARPTGNIFYAGWDRSGSPVRGAVGIHHPRGDIKKICLDTNNLNSTTWQNAQVWKVLDWDFGVTEPGSSGSPLFDLNGRIIGQLYGGGAACQGTNDNGRDDNYGRFSVSWNGNNTNATRLRNWLDPAGSNLSTLDGYDPNARNIALDGNLENITNLSGRFCNVQTFTPEVQLRNEGTNALSSVLISYQLNNQPSQTYTWTGNLASRSSIVISLPSITVTQTGMQVFTANILQVNGQADTILNNNLATANFEVVLNAQDVGFFLQPDCYGDETSWELRNLQGQVLLSGGPFTTRNNPPRQDQTWCLAPGCYDFVIYDDYGDGLFGGQGCNVGTSPVRNFGNYFGLSPLGDTLFSMTAVNGDFGDSAVHRFCVLGSLPSALEQVGSGLRRLEVFPNPTGPRLQIRYELAFEQQIRVQILAATGQVLRSEIWGQSLEGLNSMELGDLPAGFYLLRFETDTEVLTRKIIKQ